MVEMSKYLLLGLGSGIFAGVFGVGGGLIIIPILVLWFNFDFKMATGTSLAALVPPTGLLGAINYYKNHNVNINAALLIAAGLFVGIFFGSLLVPYVKSIVLKRCFSVFLIFVAIKMFDPVGFYQIIIKYFAKN